MTSAARVEMIDRQLANRSEISSYRFVSMLNARIYAGTWDDAMRDALDALCEDVHDRLYAPREKLPQNLRGAESVGRSNASANASDAYNSARRNFICAIIEQHETGTGAKARSQMEVMRDKRAAENQLVAFLTFTGFMGSELAREYVRNFEGLVKREINAAVGCQAERC